MTTKNHLRKKILLNMIKLRVSNIIISLAGILIFSILKDSDLEQTFYISFVGLFVFYNIIQGFFLLLKYEETKFQDEL